jgi:hypothetical protein
MTRNISRRSWISSLAGGFGAATLADLLASPEAKAAEARARGPRFAPKAKRCIFLFMTGGPSQVDLFDPKPALLKPSWSR